MKRNLLKKGRQFGFYESCWTNLEEKFSTVFTERQGEEGLSDKVVGDGGGDGEDVGHFDLDLFALNLRNVHVPRYQCLEKKLPY